MTVSQTGNAEIDQQHEILDAMLVRLEARCQEVGENPEATCGDCSEERQQQCRSRLAAMIGELSLFIVGHSTYEERMMELLPDTPTCQAHIRAHKAAHEGVVRQLKKLAMRVASQPPRETSIDVWRTIGDWLGDHSSLFDNRLVRMTKSASAAPDYDGELVVMLDRHVFPNRPIAQKSMSGNNLSRQKAKMDARGRIESLSPMQKKVFWLVLAGRKNRQIAEELGITVNTVKTHRAAIFLKMDVSSVVELVKKADGFR